MKIYKRKDIEAHDDDRGFLRVIPNDQAIQRALYCTGNPKAVRGSHVHEADSHYCYVTKGTIRYEYKEADDQPVSSVILEPGDMVFTQPGEIHRFVFVTHGAFIALSTLPRTQESYEHDTTKKTF